MNDSLSQEDRETLLAVAKQSIVHGLETGRPLSVNKDDYVPALQETRGTFVTLNLNEQLRGCIGTLDAYQPLVQDVAEHAFAAAFKDPRFTPLQQHELESLDIHISILMPSEPMPVNSERELLDNLRPGIDGLILEDGYHKATFLPSVWGQLPNPGEFIAHLKMKAGLPVDHWSDSIRFRRYTTESFGKAPG